MVWHRFLRFPEARTLAFDAPWFRTNIMLRLKSHGANMLRFHLGLPPDRLLDLCDQEGLMVQMEWPFFHGIKASDESMREQWQAWLDVAMRHPSVMIIHPWNETDGDELKAGWKAMNAVLANYPPLVVAHRDTIHIHKYLGARAPGPLPASFRGKRWLNVARFPRDALGSQELRNA